MSKIAAATNFSPSISEELEPSPRTLTSPAVTAISEITADTFCDTANTSTLKTLDRLNCTSPFSSKSAVSILDEIKGYPSISFYLNRKNGSHAHGQGTQDTTTFISKIYIPFMNSKNIFDQYSLKHEFHNCFPKNQQDSYQALFKNCKNMASIASFLINAKNLSTLENNQILNIFYKCKRHEPTTNFMNHFENLYYFRCLISYANQPSGHGHCDLIDSEILNDTKMQFLKSLSPKESKYFDKYFLEKFTNSETLKEAYTNLSQIIETKNMNLKRYKNAKRNTIFLISANFFILFSIICLLVVFFVGWIKIGVKIDSSDEIFGDNYDVVKIESLGIFDHRLFSSQMCYLMTKNLANEPNSENYCHFEDHEFTKGTQLLVMLTFFLLIFITVSHPVVYLTTPDQYISLINQGPPVENSIVQKFQDNNYIEKPISLRPHSLVTIGNGVLSFLCSFCMLLGTLLIREFVVNVTIPKENYFYDGRKVPFIVEYGPAYYLGYVMSFVLFVAGWLYVFIGRSKFGPYSLKHGTVAKVLRV